MSVRTRPMFAIPFAINLGSVAVISRRCGFASCNQRAHDPPMFAIPTPDVCRSLQISTPVAAKNRSARSMRAAGGRAGGLGFGGVLRGQTFTLLGIEHRI